MYPLTVRHRLQCATDAKAKAETAVQIAQRSILAALRDMLFFSVGELNQAIAPRLEQINAQPFQKLEGSRNQWFETLDKPKLRPLPPSPFVVATWLEATVNIDYHVVVDHHPYSVPYQLVGQKLEARYTSTIVEIYHKGQRLLSHLRRYDHQPSTLAEHMPSAHRAHAEWTPSRLIRWAEKTGPSAGRVVKGTLESRPHPEQGYRACLGLMRLGRRYGAERLEAACV